VTETIALTGSAALHMFDPSSARAMRFFLAAESSTQQRLTATAAASSDVCAFMLLEEAQDPSP
jgi:hypothetical protein